MIRMDRSKFDIGDLARRLRRIAEGAYSSYRRLFVLLVGLCIFFYILPPVFRLVFYSGADKKDFILRCMDDRLTPYILANREFEANICHVPPLPDERDFVPYVGNGYFGLAITPGATFNIKYGRAMHLPISFQPMVSVRAAPETGKSATVVEYNTGIVNQFQCANGYFVTQAYYAHRSYPGILMQEIKITVTSGDVENMVLELPQAGFQKKQISGVKLERPLQLGPLSVNEIEVVSASVVDDAGLSIAIIIAQPKVDRTISVRKHSTVRFAYPISLHYSKPLKQHQLAEEFAKAKKQAVDALNNILLKLNYKSDLQFGLNALRQEHINVWNDLWATGFSISTSKAEKSLNGDRINATMYAVLSQTRSYEYESFPSASGPKPEDISRALIYAEGCYGSYHTLEAENLWRPMYNLAQLNSLVSSWMLTLEKQGCHNLIRAGASGVIQAMVLSFGSFKFSNQHLECNMEPKYLHRDFHFRRLNYGNKTHVNVTITVTEDNKAVIYVALDRSDRSYYACDAGCLDKPILLRQSRYQFPVKLTEPPTAILYITEDKQHMEELNRAIHVKEIIEAPAHEQHVIALHKHGHHLGGLPIFFWVSICLIIIVFHVFLCKLIIKEYCDPADKLRYRYNKP